MTISQTIKQLEQFKEVFGDIDILIQQQDSIGEYFIDETSEFTFELGSRFIKEDVHENVIIIS